MIKIENIKVSSVISDCTTTSHEQLPFKCFKLKFYYGFTDIYPSLNIILK